MNQVHSMGGLDATLKALCKRWPDIKRFLRSFGCPGREAEDIFQEALLVFTRKLDDPGFELTIEPFYFRKIQLNLAIFHK